MILILTIIGLISLFSTFFILTYKVVDPNEAHVIVFMGRGRKVYAPKLISDEGVKTSARTAYFYIPFLMKRFVMPLTNVKMDINNIHLNDIQVAPFVCDVITWVHISNPVIAAERLNLSGNDTFSSLREDLINIVQATARAASMKQEVLEIMKDRKTFSESVSKEVDPLLKKWGIDLINLEVNDIKDDIAKESQVISDYESIRKVSINSRARKETSILEREAVEVEQENKKKSEIAVANSEKEYMQAKLNTEKEVGIAAQKRDLHIGITEKSKENEIAKADDVANKSKIEAHRTIEVGKAKVLKEAVIEKATGEADAIKIKGEKEADVTTLKGIADGNAIEAKGSAEAISKDKMAEAMQKFNDAAMKVEKIRAEIEVEKFKWEAYGKVAQNAEIKIVNSGNGADLFGIPMNAETGANLGKMLEGVDLSKAKGLIESTLGEKINKNKQ